MKKLVVQAVCLLTVGITIGATLFNFLVMPSHKTGEVRTVEAHYYKDGIFEDETGNLWGWDDEIDKKTTYTLYIDNLGDTRIDNDEIVKVQIK